MVQRIGPKARWIAAALAVGDAPRGNGACSGNNSAQGKGIVARGARSRSYGTANTSSVSIAPGAISLPSSRKRR
jgi:hypothetical protein